MRPQITSIILTGMFICLANAPVRAAEEDAGSRGGVHDGGIGGVPQDPSFLMDEIQQRRAQRDSLLPLSPLKPLHDFTDSLKDDLYAATRLRIGLTINHLFQGATDTLYGTDNWGTTTDADLIASWELVNVGKPTKGSLFVHLEGRWDYGTDGPQDLGFGNLASLIGSGNAFSGYTPTFLFRNIYWEQGSKEAGWAFRIGKITPDALLATSNHITPVTTFLPNGGTGLFASGYPDSGIGAVGVWYPTDDIRILGLISDANADRYDFGAPGKGDLYKALEFGFKLCPRTEKAGYSKITLWHSDGTYNGRAINASTGKDGSGVTVKLEQELTDDGRAIGILRWGRSWDDSSLYEQQAGAHFVLYDPLGKGGMQNDLVGIAFNWVKGTAATARDEYNAEIFYRFPLFPGVDTTLSYQSVWNPAFNTQFDHSHIFSLRLRTVF